MPTHVHFSIFCVTRNNQHIFINNHTVQHAQNDNINNKMNHSCIEEQQQSTIYYLQQQPDQKYNKNFKGKAKLIE